MPLVLVAALAAGLFDRGIFSDLDSAISVQVPVGVTVPTSWLRVDRAHGVVTLYEGDNPMKAWPIVDGGSVLERANVTLRPEDRDELSRYVTDGTPVIAASPSRAEDRDGDGIVDRLDIALGAKKLIHNRARYIDRYVSIKYPGGDVPRFEGVCTDTVVRALRNAGIDLQKEIHDDILAAPHAYPMVHKIDTSIDHRRVRTILPWFKRHWTTLPEGARFLPGDLVFFDTFPSRPGPDHVGVVSDAEGPNRLPMVINNWTAGAVDAEMDLLSWVPVTHHFRAPSIARAPTFQH